MDTWLWWERGVGVLLCCPEQESLQLLVTAGITEMFCWRMDQTQILPQEVRMVFPCVSHAETTTPSASCSPFTTPSPFPLPPALRGRVQVSCKSGAKINQKIKK